mgnify:CR=1 FL=1
MVAQLSPTRSPTKYARPTKLCKTLKPVIFSRFWNETVGVLWKVNKISQQTIDMHLEHHLHHHLLTSQVGILFVSTFSAIFLYYKSYFSCKWFWKEDTCFFMVWRVLLFAFCLIIGYLFYLIIDFCFCLSIDFCFCLIIDHFFCSIFYYCFCFITNYCFCLLIDFRLLFLLDRVDGC